MGNRIKSTPGPDGASPAGGEKFSLISDEKLILLYKKLLQWRATGQRGGNRKGASGSVRGHEAAVVGTAIDLGPGDVACSLDRHVLCGISNGDAIDKLLLDSGRNGRGGDKTKATTNGLSRSPVAHAVIGTALANKTARNGKVAVVYCANESDCLKEAVHIATVHALPVVFVQHGDRGAGRVVGNANGKKRNKEFPDETPWFPSITVDCHDVVAVYRVAFEAISRARMGSGPTLIECVPFDFVDGAMNGNRRHTDSVRNMEHYLRAKGLFDARLKREMVAEMKGN